MTLRSTVPVNDRPTRTETSDNSSFWPQQSWVVSLYGMAAFLLLGFVVVVRVGEQTVRIEIDTADAEVFIDGNQVTIKNLGALIELKPGEHNLEIRRGDVIVQADQFQVVDGANPILKISLVKPTEENAARKDRSDPNGQEAERVVNRQVADWVFKNHGWIAYVTEPGKGGHYISSPKSLPQGPFFLYEVNLSKRTTVTQEDVRRVTQEDMRRLMKLSRLIVLKLPDCQITDEHVRLLENHPKMFSLDLSRNPITDAGVTFLRGLEGLKHLKLSGTQITEDGIRQLKELPNLTDLAVGAKDIHDASLEPLLQMPGLDTLNLDGSAITDTGVSKLKSLSNLWELSLNETQVTDAAIKALAGHRRLHRLNVANTNITDAGLKELKAIPELISLDVSGCEITNEGIIDHLSGLRNLSELKLSNTPLTDEGLEALGNLPNLRILVINDTKVTAEGEKQKAALNRPDQ